MPDVHGLKHFSDYFDDVKDMFVIVGGVASSLLMDEAGLDFRKTKDIDLVIVANPSHDLTRKLKEYVKQGEYKEQQASSGKPTFYRFKEPQSKEFPFQIEVFAKNDEELELFEGQHIVPIKTEEGVGDLSAILIEEEYFQLIKDNRRVIANHSVATEVAIIPLKARAYNDLTDRKGDSREIRKHRNDIMKLTLNLEVGGKASLDGLPRNHLERCLKDIAAIPDNEFKQIMAGLPAKNVDEIVSILRSYFL